MSARHGLPGRDGPVALCCLVPAVGLMTFAEVWQAAGAATLSLDLAPGQSRGAHLSVFGFFQNCQGVLGPVILAPCVGAGAIGLSVLAAAFIGAAALMARVPVSPRVLTEPEPPGRPPMAASGSADTECSISLAGPLNQAD